MFKFELMSKENAKKKGCISGLTVANTEQLKLRSDTVEEIEPVNQQEINDLHKRSLKAPDPDHKESYL